MTQSHLERQAANFTPLSPLSFLRRSRDVYPQRPAVIYGARRYSWAQVYERAARLASALVARGVQRGETPCAFVELNPDCDVSEREIIDFCRTSLAGFKAPKRAIFGELPKTSTGKIEKYKLRQLAREV